MTSLQFCNFFSVGTRQVIKEIEIMCSLACQCILSAQSMIQHCCLVPNLNATSVACFLQFSFFNSVWRPHLGLYECTCYSSPACYLSDATYKNSADFKHACHAYAYMHIMMMMVTLFLMWCSLWHQKETAQDSICINSMNTYELTYCPKWQIARVKKCDT